MKKITLIFILCLLPIIASANENDTRLEKRRQNIEKHLKKFREAKNNDLSFALTYDNIDFSQIKYDDYNGFYHKIVNIKGLSDVNEEYYIEISEHEIHIGYVRDVKVLLRKEKKENGEEAHIHIVESEGTTWIFSIDEKDNIELDSIKSIG